MLEDLKNLFRGSNFIGQIILINAAVFLIQNILENIQPSLYRQVIHWMAMPSLLPSFLWKPWTAVSYMFFHGGFSHLFWNMINLYWFGRFFGDFLGTKRLIGTYFLGGVAGALFYLAVANLRLLSGEAVADIPLIGASAGIMAVLAVTGLRYGDVRMNLLFIGPVQLRYVALAIFILSTIVDLGVNTGGKMSHLGGAAFGYFYHKSLDSGRDLSLAAISFFEKIKSWFRRKPKLKTVHRSETSTSTGYQGMTSAEKQARTDAILDKISKSGYDNLTKEEKEFLFKMGNKS